MTEPTQLVFPSTDIGKKFFFGIHHCYLIWTKAPSDFAIVYLLFNELERHSLGSGRIGIHGHNRIPLGDRAYRLLVLVSSSKHYIASELDYIAPPAPSRIPGEPQLNVMPFLEL